MRNYLDMGRDYKHMGMIGGAIVLGAAIITGGTLAVGYGIKTATTQITAYYDDWKNTQVPETFPLVEQEKQPQTLDDVIKEGKWKMTSGLELKPAEGTSDAGLHLKEYLKIYETEEAVEGKREGKPEEKIYQKQEEQK